MEMPPVVHSQRGSRSGREREWYAETSLNHCRAIKRSLRRFVSSRTKSTPIAVGDKTLSGSCWRSLSTGQNILRVAKSVDGTSFLIFFLNLFHPEASSILWILHSLINYQH